MPTPVATAAAADDAGAEAEAGVEAEADDATVGAADEAADVAADDDVDAGAELFAFADELLHADTIATITIVVAAMRSEVRGRRVLGHESCAVGRVFGTVTPWLRSAVRS